MSTNPRITRSPGPFNNYINHASPYLSEGTPVTNAARLGITEDEVTIVEEIKVSWNKLWDQYSDKKISRTRNITDQVYGKIDEMVDFDKSHHFLDRIASSMNATIEDMEVFNIRAGKMQRASVKNPIKSISDVVMPVLEQLGGAVVSIKCYSVESSRPCIHSMATCVQFAYRIGGTMPQSPNDEGMIYDSSTRSSINVSFGPENSGKQLFIYFRWYNSIHPNLAGPWSAVLVVWLS